MNINTKHLLQIFSQTINPLFKYPKWMLIYLYHKFTTNRYKQFYGNDVPLPSFWTRLFNPPRQIPFYITKKSDRELFSLICMMYAENIAEIKEDFKNNIHFVWNCSTNKKFNTSPLQNTDVSFSLANKIKEKYLEDETLEIVKRFFRHINVKANIIHIQVGDDYIFYITFERNFNLEIIKISLEQYLCCICFEKPISISIVHPKTKTSHFCVCDDCSKKLKNICPICRQKFSNEDLIKTFVETS